MKDQQVLFGLYIKAIFDKYGIVSESEMIKIILEDLEILKKVAQQNLQLKN